MRILSRVSNLVRGSLAQWIGRREHRNPAAVYEAAIDDACRAVRSTAPAPRRA